LRARHLGNPTNHLLDAILGVLVRLTGLAVYAPCRTALALTR
jgi:hypothetical protein